VNDVSTAALKTKEKRENSRKMSKTKDGFEVEHPSQKEGFPSSRTQIGTPEATV
jgi:hypothetical protein